MKHYVLHYNCHYLQTLKSCSENFPIQNYTININNSREFPLQPSSLPPPGITVTRQLNDRDIPELLPDVIYSLSVTACSDFTCKESNSTQFREYTFVAS